MRWILAVATLVAVWSQPCVDVQPVYQTFRFIDPPTATSVGLYRLDSFNAANITQRAKFPSKYLSELVKLEVEVAYATNMSFCLRNSPVSGSSGVGSVAVQSYFTVWLPGQFPSETPHFFNLTQTGPAVVSVVPVAPGDTGCLNPATQPEQFAALPHGVTRFEVAPALWPRFFGPDQLFMRVGSFYETDFRTTLSNFDHVEHWWLAVNVSLIPSFLQVNVTKKTNNAHFTSAPGASLVVPETVNWAYDVTNYGTVPVSQLAVTDSDPSVVVVCPEGIIDSCHTVTCTASASSVEGAYSNTATCETVHADAAVPCANTDASYYFGYAPRVTLHKFTNAIDTTVPGAEVPQVPEGAPVTWTYVIENTGNCELDNVGVEDDSVAVGCPSTSLGVGALLTCAVTGSASVGGYTNVATASGFCNQGTDGAEVTSETQSSYEGVSQSIGLVKKTNGVQVITPEDTPFLRVFDDVTWSYEVSNTGSVDLLAITVVDNQLGDISASCPSSELVSGASMTCVVVGTVAEAGYTNVATASAYSVFGPAFTVSADSASSYFGVVEDLRILKRTNGVDISSTNGVGPYVQVGNVVQWSYEVTNHGNTDLTAVVVTDDDQSVSVTCPVNTLGSGGSSMVCSGSGVVIEGAYTNVGSVAAVSPLGGVSATSSSNYFGARPSLRLSKLTNGVDTHSTSAPTVALGNQVVWTYVVTNNGNTALSNVAISDDRLSPTSVCQTAGLGVDVSFTCFATGTANTAEYVNVGTATYDTVFGDSRMTTYSSAYFGAQLSLSLVKTTNAQHPATQAEGPLLTVGRTVTWRYIVTNTGSRALSSIAIHDDQEGPITCNFPASLNVNSVATCVHTSGVLIGPYANTATASGFALGNTVTATDVSFYNTLQPHLLLIKKLNGVPTSESVVPHLRAGQPITWTYEVTNTGLIALTSVQVTDDHVSPILCPTEVITLAPAESVTCSATAVALECRYRDNACATGRQVSSCDDGHYLGLEPGISVAKFTNDFDYATSHKSDNPPCLSLENSEVTWTYVVSNIGEDLLYNVHVVDDQLSVPPYCPRNQLGAWDVMTCTAVDSAVLGDYTNIASVWGSPAVGGPDVTAWDQNWYTGIAAHLDVRLFINGRRTLQVLEEGGRWSEHGEGEAERHRGHRGGGRGEGEGQAWRTESSESSPAVLPPTNRRSLKELESHNAFNKAAFEHRPMTHAELEGTGECESGPHPGRGHGEGDAEGEGHRIRWRGPVIAVGDELLVTIVVENFGSSPINSIRLSFPDANSTSNAIPFVSFLTSDVQCPQDSLAIGESMTCTVTASASAVQSVGQQRLAVQVYGEAPCHTFGIESGDIAWWWNEPADGTGDGEGEGQGHSGGGVGTPRPLKGCGVNFWRDPKSFSRYPSTSSGGVTTITPQSVFYTAAGLSADPTGHDLNVLSVLWSSDQDGLTQFLQHAAVALLNAASSQDFLPRYGTVLDGIAAAVAQYNQNSPALALHLTREWSATEDECRNK